MSKIDQAIKSEIIRLTKKQLRATCLPLAREVRQLKRTVAELRRTVAPLKVLGNEIEAQKAAEVAKLDASPDEVKGSRISGRLIKSLRSKLGVTQGELAMLVGVTDGAVGFWEQGTRPGDRSKAALVALRKLGKREVRKLLEKKKAEAKPEPEKKRRKRKAKGR